MPNISLSKAIGPTILNFAIVLGCIHNQSICVVYNSALLTIIIIFHKVVLYFSYKDSTLKNVNDHFSMM